eukprot:768076-Hanusia_phi.AAC.3
MRAGRNGSGSAHVADFSVTSGDRIMDPPRPSRPPPLPPRPTAMQEKINTDPQNGRLAHVPKPSAPETLRNVTFPMVSRVCGQIYVIGNENGAQRRRLPPPDGCCR